MSSLPVCAVRSVALRLCATTDHVLALAVQFALSSCPLNAQVAFPFSENTKPVIQPVTYAA